MKALTGQTSGTASLSITDQSSLEIGGNNTGFSNQSIRAYVYNLGNASAATPIIVNLTPAPANITNYDDTYVNIAISTVNQNVQGAKVYLRFDPTKVSIEGLVGSIPDFGTSIFQSRIVDGNTLEIQSGVSLSNQSGFNGTGTFARLKLRALSTQKGITEISVLDSSTFGITSTTWIGISTSSVKAYTFQLNESAIATSSLSSNPATSAEPRRSTRSSSLSSSNSSLSSSRSSSLSSSMSATSSISSIGAIRTSSPSVSSALPSTGILDSFGGNEWMIYLFVGLALIAIVGLPMLTKVGSFERSIVKS